MNITDIQAAIDCYNSYWNFSVFDKQITIDGVDVKIIFRQDRIRIVFPGSKSFLDWERDLASIREVQHPQLGSVGNGWLIGVDDIFNVLSPLIAKDIPIVFEGHSLGAARAVVQAGKFIVNGYDPKNISIIVFGCPHPGGKQLLDIISKAGYFRAYRNGQDPVTEVPTIEMGGLPIPVIAVTSQPVALDSWPLAVKWHHIQAYIVSLSVGSLCN